MTTKKEVKYLANDFDSYVANFENFIKSYFPSTYKDFSDLSTGKMLIDIAAGGSDIITVYLNRAYNELMLSTAVQKESIYNICTSLGYKPTKRAASLVEQTLYVQVPAEYSSGIPLPDYRYAPVAKRGSRFLSTNGIKFESLYDIDYSTATGSGDFAPSVINSMTSQVEWFSLRKNTLAISAQTKQKTFTVSDFVRFRKLTIDDSESIDVYDVIDSQANKWYEVNYLVQDIVFESSVNTNYDNALVPYILKLKRVPRRFITEFDYNTGYLSLVFGAGNENSDDSDLIPNVSDISIPLYGKSYFSGFSIDPQNFLNTKTLGISPYNTTLNVFYRAGGGASSVVKANSINKIDNLVYEYKYSSLSDNIKAQVANSFGTTNLGPAIGGRDELTTFEIKQNASAFFSAQDRCVTTSDYHVRLLSLPTIFGAFRKVNVKKNCRSSNIIDIVVLCYDENKNFSAPTETLIQNAKNYLTRYAGITDNVQMRPAEIINFTINYVVVCEQNANRSVVLSQCTNAIISYFNKDNWQINQPIIRSNITKSLQDIDGVYSVSKIDFEFTTSSIQEKNGVIYTPNEDCIFQIENTATDITGVTL